MSSATILETDDETAPPSPAGGPAWGGPLAGVLAGATSLALGELFDALWLSVPSLVVSAGEWFRDAVPGDFVKVAIELFGTNDKPALIAGTTIVTLAIAAIVGAAARRRRWVGDVTFAAFGLIGGVLASDASQAEAGPAWASALVAAAAGWVVLRLLLSRLDAPAPTRFSSQGGGLVDEPTNPAATRRAFLAYSGGAAAFAAGAVGVGRLVRGDSAAEQAREELLATTPTGVDGPVEAVTGGLDTLDGVDGITPYVSPNDGFYLIDTALTKPQVDPATWRLSFTGMVDEPYELTYDEILDMDLVDQAITLSCVSNEVGGDLVGNAVWTGVPLVDLLERAGVQPGATQVVGRSVDDFTAGFPTENLYDGRNALLAVHMNGEPLPIKHGFPARMVVAGLYGYVSAVKWVTEIRLTTLEDFDGYWIPRGWSKLGPIKTQSRIDVPRSGETVPAGPTAVAGIAWAPTRGVDRVEVSVDGGEWREARVGGVASDETWAQWVYEWDAAPGEHTLAVRAVDGDGEVQPAEPVPPRPDGAEGHHSIRVDVSGA